MKAHTARYSGTVFEPIDAYKGDLARGQLYVATRYFNDDQAWPGGPPADGAELYPWAAAQYLAWSQADPVSWKERMRNGAVQVYQHNRNPFVDHPEFVAMIYDSSTVVGVGAPGLAWRLRLRANQPNPFATRTTIVFDLALRAPVTLRLYNAAGRFVRTLVAGEEMAPGSHAVEWDGVDDAGRRVGAGIYFAQLAAGPETATRRVVAVPR